MFASCTRKCRGSPLVARHQIKDKGAQDMKECEQNPTRRATRIYDGPVGGGRYRAGQAGPRACRHGGAQRTLFAGAPLTRMRPRRVRVSASQARRARPRHRGPHRMPHRRHPRLPLARRERPRLLGRPDHRQPGKPTFNTGAGVAKGRGPPSVPDRPAVGE